MPTNKAGMNMTPQGGGQIKISRVEEMALIALETSADPDEAVDRAMEDSGLSQQQVEALRDRADAMRKKGYTLVGAMITLKPKGADEDHALISDRDGDGIPDDEDEGDQGDQGDQGDEAQG
jgi:hypothetical protein